ncbi:hypothetical protein BO443_130202 [Burkholderia orbicola]
MPDKKLSVYPYNTFYLILDNLSRKRSPWDSRTANEQPGFRSKRYGMLISLPSSDGLLRRILTVEMSPMS